jgi:hypothetical protein
VPTNNLLIRIIAAGLPLVLIALIAGASGYVSKGRQTTPIPPLPPEKANATGILGAVQSLSNDRLTIVANDGTPMSFDLPGESTIERLMPISREELAIGDWINGGAIPHAETKLALVGLVLVSDPVLNTP